MVEPLALGCEWRAFEVLEGRRAPPPRISFASRALPRPDRRANAAAAIVCRCSLATASSSSASASASSSAARCRCRRWRPRECADARDEAREPTEGDRECECDASAARLARSK